MEQSLESVIHNVVEVFETTPTTEDTRSGIDRRCKKAKAFPLTDRQGNVISAERRVRDRRKTKIDIDDISEYVQNVS
jgi:hypothetical protein